MRKKTFFEKLTGVVKVDDENNDQEIEGQTGEETEEKIETEGQLAVDMYETPSEIILKAMVAGVKSDDLDISITRDMVIVKGKREESNDIVTSDYFHRELYWGSFSRTVMLPREINVDESEAINKNGLLIIKMPKIDKDRQTKLKIKNG